MYVFELCVRMYVCKTAACGLLFLGDRHKSLLEIMSARGRPVFDLSKGMLSTIRLSSGFDMPVVGLGMYKVEVGENAYEVCFQVLFNFF